VEYERLAELQARLRSFEDVTEERTIVSIPSINLDQSILDAHVAGLPAYEERSFYLLFALRRPRTHLVMCTSLPVLEEVIEHHLSLMPEAPDARERLHFVSPDDPSPRPLAEKLIERPDLVEEIRSLSVHDPVVVPFNVGDPEHRLGLALDIPIYGIDGRFDRYGTKSGGRQLFGQEGVPHPAGFEDLRSRAALGRAVMTLRRANPGLGAVVAKHDDGVFGAGNATIALRDLPDSGSPAEQAAIDVRLRSLPGSWIEGLRERGGIVEEMVVGEEIRSPSVQLRILPGGRPNVVSTHDQVLGGALAQQFIACRFPADERYAARIVEEALKVGRRLAAEGAVGRFGVDFVVVRRDDGEWDAWAVEINLREGGTSHPYGTLWLLTDGSMDEDKRAFRLPGGEERCYFASDNVEDERYRSLRLLDVLRAAQDAGLVYDPGRSTGLVLHMLRSLEVEGRIAAVAIGRDPDEAHTFYVRLVELLDSLAQSSSGPATSTEA
jgi:hypothetical protein